ncbi:MAG: alpha/beta hydrolase [Flavobacteriales bacterium]|nr:alpha/beta hydrolase [Flavobacteriales bacterium]
MTTHYAPIHGLNMYYEIHGAGNPLVLIHGGGSTIQTSFGRVIPLFAKHRKVIAVEMQAHGRTGDRDADLTFEQDADDIAALLQHLNIPKADILGFSNGGTTALQTGIRHPEVVNRIIAISPLCKRHGAHAWFWDFMPQAKLENMPQPLQDAYLEVAPDPNSLQVMHDRDAKRMVNFKDIPDALLQSIQAPTLILAGDNDVVTPEHAQEMERIIPNAKAVVIPGGHGACIGEITTLTADTKETDFAVEMMEDFLG